MQNFALSEQEMIHLIIFCSVQKWIHAVEAPCIAFCLHQHWTLESARNKTVCFGCDVFSD